MNVKIDASPFIFKGDKTFSIKDSPTQLPPLYQDKKEYKDLMKEFEEELDDLQNMMYAHDRYSMLLIFQAMDAAGKDGTIRHVMSGINPHGVVVHSFKKPSIRELDHNYLWRTNYRMPERGRIGIFNRSYYEEVLVVKVHPKIVKEYQHIPDEFKLDMDALWERRYQEIKDFERYAHHNGTRVIKFFLNLSKEEQRKRFLARIDEQEKNWKFSNADVKERQYWDQYMQAYEEGINATATDYAPWHVIPADDKRNMRLMVSGIILDTLKEMKMNYPVVNDTRRAELQEMRKQLENE